MSAVLFALFLTTLMTTASLAVDLGSSRQLARRIQSSTDAAALAAARQLPLRADTPDPDYWLSTAREVAAGYAARNLHGVGAAATPVSCPPGTGGVAANAACFTSQGSSIVVEAPFAVAGQPLNPRHFVSVTVCEDTPTYFAATVGLEAPRVCRQAVARRYQAGLSHGRGLLTVDPEACPGLEIQGSSDVKIDSAGGVFVDSSCGTAMEGTGAKWTLSASVISMVGDFAFNACKEDTCTLSRTPLVRQPPVGDPLRDLPAPPKPGTAAVCHTSGSEIRCRPGYHDDSPKKFGNGNLTVVLEPGIHWFSNGVEFGSLDVRVADAPVSTDPDGADGAGLGTGTGALLYVDRGSFDLSGNGTVDLRPPTAGTYEGISIFTGRDNLAVAKITGNTGSRVGTIYTPEAKLELGGNTGWTVTGMVVAARTSLFGTMDLRIDPKEPASAQPPVEDLGLER